jgi:hypothetical protein
MKIHPPLKWATMCLFSGLLMLPALYSQARYGHVPRVKVERSAVKPTTVKDAPITPVAATPLFISAEKETDSLAGPFMHTVPVITVTANHHDLVAHPLSDMRLQHVPVVTNRLTHHNDFFTSKLKKERTLLRVKQTQKTALLGYLIWFILVLILAVIFFVLAFVFLYLVFLTLYYLFLAFGIAALVILALVLILGLVGII